LLRKLEGHYDEIPIPANDEVPGLVLFLGEVGGLFADETGCAFSGAFNDTSLHLFHRLRDGVESSFWELSEEERTFHDVELVNAKE
jgi:hypothetical protein